MSYHFSIFQKYNSVVIEVVSTNPRLQATLYLNYTKANSSINLQEVYLHDFYLSPYAIEIEPEFRQIRNHLKIAVVPI